MYKRLLILITCFFTVINLCACGTNSNIDNDIVTIRFSWWGGESRHDKTVEAIQKFEEKHTNIKVKVEFGEWTGFKKRMSMKIAGNEEADLMQINYDWLQTYSSDGLGFYDLNLLSDTIQLNNFSSEILEYGKKNGILNAIPISMNGKVIYYNKSLYNSIFNTWDELLNSRTESYAEDQYPIKLDKINAWILPMAYVQQKTGHTFITQEGELGFTQDDLKMLLEFYKNLVDKKIIYDVFLDETQYLNDNKTSALIGWVSDAAKIDNSVQNSEGIDFGDIPSVDGNNKIRYVKPSMMYAISKNTDHPKEAAMLLDFLLNDEEAVKIQGIDRGLPTSSKAESILESDNQLTGIQYKVSKVDENVQQILISPYYENNLVQNVYINALEKVIYNQGSIDQCAADTYSELIKILDSLKK